MPGTEQRRDPPVPCCPVCGRPTGPEPRCPECGWILRSPLQAGTVTAHLREEFTLRRQRAQHALDTRIAARVSADPVAYQHYIRGGAPDDAQWSAARRDASQDAGDAVDETALRARLADLVGGLREDVPAAVAEVSADGIAMTRTGLDRFGSPWLDRTPGTAWTSLLPMLSGTEEERYFQLAGGLSRVDRAAVSDHLRASLPDTPHGDLIVICRPAGWLVLEWAAAALMSARPGARLLRVAGEPGGSRP